MSEYNNNQTGNGCNYTSLGGYNNASLTGNKGAIFAVPQYGGGAGYDTLQHGVGPSCSGYFNINSAYGTNCGGMSAAAQNSTCRR
jgi:hypothetical protein